MECQLLSLGCSVDGLMMGCRSWLFQKHFNWVDIALLHCAFLRLPLRWIYKMCFCAEEHSCLNTAAAQKYLCCLLPSSMIKNRCRKLFCCFRAAQISLYIQAENRERLRIISLVIWEYSSRPVFQLEGFTKVKKILELWTSFSPIYFSCVPCIVSDPLWS